MLLPTNPEISERLSTIVERVILLATVLACKKFRYALQHFYSVIN